ncbi:MAG TPA: effector binding domain-containing protein [Candidatus Gallacutalibacter stercoravium]|nr:effector binding domain-containing protein [Candidatus Gallacutalibacter stercoravium]
MELLSISRVSQMFHISTRTLRYYEQIGLITPQKKENFAYRTYDEEAIVRLQQIIVLRKLRVPLKQIEEILRSGSAKTTFEILKKKLSEIEDELNALSTIRTIINAFIHKLHLNTANFTLQDDESLLELVDDRMVSKRFKEEKTMSELNQASKKLDKLTDRDVRIVYLPPATVAAYQYVGEDPEMHCHQVMDKFVVDTGLYKTKPDIRHYGFNAPNPVDESGYHGYEVWVTIPDDMEVPSPIVKKRFEGGLYAAHMIPFGAFEEWGLLCEWVQNSSKYQSNSGNKGSECMWGLLEEHLNYINHVCLENTEPEDLQLDLLHPIKEIHV